MRMDSQSASYDGAVEFGPFRFIRGQRSLTRDGVAVAIGGRALDILGVLIERAGSIVSGPELMELVWHSVVVEDANLRTQLTALRKALGDGLDGSRYIVNVPSQGYTFVASLRRESAEAPAEVPLPTVEQRLSKQIPLLPRVMVGRHEVVAKLTTMLRGRRFVTLVGTGGIGKTTVAIAVARAINASEDRTDVCFVDLQAVTNPADVSSFIASALGCVVPVVSPEQALVTYLSSKTTCLVLDNCEHIIDAVAPLAEQLVREVRTLSIFATSREALRVAGENVFLLPPLDVPNEGPISAAAALQSSAVQLFMERAIAGGFQGSLNDIDAPLVADICRRLDGVALAIELAASRVGFYGIRGTAELLHSGGALHMHGKRNAAPRHQTLEALLTWSINLLSFDEQTTLFRLAVFASSFSLRSARAVLQEGPDDAARVQELITSLVDKSLIITAHGRDTVKYRLLDITRGYALAKLRDCNEETEVFLRLGWYMIERLSRDLDQKPNGCSIENCAHHLANIHSLLTWCFSKNGDRRLGIQIASKAAPLLISLSQFADCQRWCNMAIAELSPEDRGGSLHLMLLEAQAKSCMYTRNGSHEARVLIQDALDLSRTLRDQRCQLNLLADLNVFLTRQGKFDDALNTAEQSFAVATEIGGRRERVLAEWMLSASYHLAGDQAAALHHWKIGQEAAAINPVVKLDLFHEARAGFASARALWLAGFPDRALKAAREAIAENAKFQDNISFCATLVYATPVLFWWGKRDEAARHIELAVEQATRQGLSAFRALALALRGEMLVRSGEPARGVAVLQDAIGTMHAERYEISTSSASAVLATALSLCGRCEEAHAIADAAIYAAERRSERLWMPDLMLVKARIANSQNNPDFGLAEEYYLRSIEQAKLQSALGWELRAAIPLTRMLIETGRHSRADGLLKETYERFTEGFESTDLVEARGLIERSKGSAIEMAS
jgi:predicted ATPase/DNA-binding winged helix-turn-helix (wHTH) protein